MEDKNPDFSNMPTLAKVKSVIKELESLKWEKFKPGDSVSIYNKKIEETLTGILGGISLNYRWFDGSRTLPFNFYRVRPFDEFKNIRLRNEYSYPPAIIPSHQRANLPGYPVFYASDFPLTAVIEVIRTHKNLSEIKDRYFCLSVWKVTGDQSAVLAPLLYDGIPTDNPLYEFGQYTKGQEPEELKSLFTPDQIAGMEEMLKFYSRVFQNDDQYTISSFIGHRHLYNDVDAPDNQPELQFRGDILIYPSIRLDKRSINYAIHPNFADERMTLSSIYKIRIKNFIEENSFLSGFTFDLAAYAHNDKGRIIWLNPDPNNELYKRKLREDFPPEIGEFQFKHSLIKE